METHFHLDRVLDPDFNMPRGPEIEHVAFLSISLLPLARNQLMTLDFMADIPTSVNTFQQRIATYTPLEHLHVHRLTLEFQFRGQIDNHQPPHTLCELIEPDHHNLADAPQSDIIWQHLHRWGLYGQPTYAGIAQITKRG